eukprot:4667653-Alexandrium_andersonii.AAC.1
MGAELSHRLLVDEASSAVSSLMLQAWLEFQAQGSSVSEIRAAMEALFASCSEEFQAIRNSQQANLQTTENLKMDIINPQRLLKTHDSKITAFEARPTGAQSASAGGYPNPVGSPPASAGVVAVRAGRSSNQKWSAQDWTSWRNGTWRGPEPSGAASQDAWGWYNENQWRSRNAAVWSVIADGLSAGPGVPPPVVPMS